MTETTTPSAQGTLWLGDPWGLAQAASSYWVDAWQRTILYADIERRVGDQYQDLQQREVLSVLHFSSDLIMSGLDLPRPVNYGLVRIEPGADHPTDETKRPFIVVDPRAGHGPGIGGFKPDSEIGAALKAGHPCYFVGFLPDPVPGQTIEDVMRAEAEFVRKVGELHPHGEGKPAVIGNCQAGWQVLMTAAVWPELFGPIIVAGAPVSYWAGTQPMRYTGGLLGGSWLTELTSDLGNGLFDGAWLVQNFENLDPANTLWAKQYNVFARADTEADRYIGFQEYWGGYVFLNREEIQYIVDNLFIGNKLSTAQLTMSDGVRIDLRNIRSPIVVFSSFGDNITPPAQALGWITDLYRDDDDVVSHDQTIVYATHDSIGHLGIFVSGSIGSREHRKFASTIDQIDVLPAGIYHVKVEDAPAQARHLNDPHLLTIQASSVEEVRAIVKPDPESDQRFAAAARLSEINLALYRTTLQPWVRAFSTSASARWLQAWHPMRVAFESWTSANPLAALAAGWAGQVREQRQPVAGDNPFLQLQREFSGAIVHALNLFRDQRDQSAARVFEAVYGSPLVQALAGQTSAAAAVRPHPGTSPEHREFVRRAQQQLEEKLLQGGLLRAALRALFYVLQHRASVDERLYHHAVQAYDRGIFGPLDKEELRSLVREQALVLAHFKDPSIDAIPGMLKGTDPQTIRTTASTIADLAAIGDDTPTAATREALKRVADLFEDAARQQEEAAGQSAVAGHQASTRSSIAKTAPKAETKPTSPSRARPRDRGSRP